MPPAMSENARSFTLEGSVPSFKTGGRYVAAKPSIAGQHAAREIFKANPGRSEVFVRLRETTRGGRGQVFMYRVTRVQRASDDQAPRKFRKPDGSTVDISPRFKYQVKAVADDQFGRGSR